MEFMAVGKPVIVTDGGGSRELVMDNVHGFLVPPSDPGAVAEVQERVDAVKSVFPLMTFGHLEFREMQVDVHPHAYLGKVQGCSSWLSAGAASAYSSWAGLAPTFIIEPKS